MKLQSTSVLVLLLALAGCGPTSYSASGTVTFDGEPIPEGHIAFVPEGSGTGGGGPITNGSYSATVPAGKMKVLITASKMHKLPPGQKGMYGKSEEIRAYIPSKYNSKTELTVDITGRTSRDFDLKSSEK